MSEYYSSYLIAVLLLLPLMLSLAKLPAVLTLYINRCKCCICQYVTNEYIVSMRACHPRFWPVKSVWVYNSFFATMLFSCPPVMLLICFWFMFLFVWDGMHVLFGPFFLSFIFVCCSVAEGNFTLHERKFKQKCNLMISNNLLRKFLLTHNERSCHLDLKNNRMFSFIKVYCLPSSTHSWRLMLGRAFAFSCCEAWKWMSCSQLY